MTATPETLRDRVAAAMRGAYERDLTLSPLSGSELDYADAAIAAIPKLSPEARETIRAALEVHEMMTRANAEPCSVGLDMEELLAIDRARAELQVLP